MPVAVRVPAKVNLHLAVGPRREDGYHELETVFCAVSLYDEVTVAPAQRSSLEVVGPPDLVRQVPSGEDNLAFRAARLVAAQTETEAGVRITLHKSIPVAGGMGGGSADAAATLVACARLWGVPVDLPALAAQLGSDVPFLLDGRAALAHGRGERLTPVLVRGAFHLVLAFAHGGLATPDVYRTFDALRPAPVGPPDAVLAALAAGDPAALGASLANDLQPAALALRPALRATLAAGEELGALGGIVCGSGPTVAFLVRDSDSAVRFAAALAGAGVAQSVRAAHGPVPGARG